MNAGSTVASFDFLLYLVMFPKTALKKNTHLFTEHLFIDFNSSMKFSSCFQETDMICKERWFVKDNPSPPTPQKTHQITWG